MRISDYGCRSIKASIAVFADLEKAWALTSNLVVSLPLPRIFTRSFLDIKPASASICASMDVSFFASARVCRVEILMRLVFLPVDIDKSEFGNPALQRHLAAFKTRFSC